MAAMICLELLVVQRTAFLQQKQDIAVLCILTLDKGPFKEVVPNLSTKDILLLKK